MAEYYTLGTIRNQIVLNGWSIQSAYFSGDQRAVDLAGNFPSNWEYCPCNISKLCIQRNTKACIVRIGIATNNPNINTSLFIEIIYIRNFHTGFIRTGQMLLESYINSGRINREALQTITI